MVGRTLKPKRPAESAVETTYLVLPPDTNTHGTAFGGKIMQWMDVAAGICAGRHCRGPVVTAAVDELVFSRPIRMADIVILRAAVNFTGCSSMEVGVRVEREEAETGLREHCLSGYFTFVALDAKGDPAEVPPIAPGNEIEVRRFEKGEQRRNRRLKNRKS